MTHANAEYLFEVSYEVCNKVGGIYTVLTSKAALMKEKYKNYIAIGPYYEQKANINMEQLPASPELEKIFENLRSEGIQCIYGKWLIPGEPRVILVDFRNKIELTNDIKKELWEKFGIDTLLSSWDFTEPMVWSWCVGRLLELIGQKYKSKKIVAHFHEWLAGISLLYLKSRNSNIKTVFTTHATMLGRTIAGSNEDLYSIIEKIDPHMEAKNRGVLDKFTTEKACANQAEIFTTVSEITSYEAEKILGRKPEVLVLNGLDIQRFPTIEETSIKHYQSRETIRDLITYYFSPYYSFNIEESLIYFILGRNEFRNKGVDIYIKSLAKLNKILKEKNSKKTIVSFLFIPQATQGIRRSLIENKNYFQEIKKDVDENNELVKTRIIRDLVSGEKLDFESIFPKEFLMSVKKTIQNFSKDESAPPLCTHNIVDENNNEIIKSLRTEGLLNLKDDKVKVILYPVYVSESDGILNLKYYEIISGCHLGIFPSYYEPWGYTPLECAALGVPSITSDMAGFGRYVEKIIKKDSVNGLYVLKRFKRNEKDVINDFVKNLYDFSKLKKHERVKQKVAAKEISMLADWSILVNNYIDAHNLALEVGK